MQHKNRVIFLSACAATLAALLLPVLPAGAATAAASPGEQALFNDEIRICVSELAKRANYTDASRVVHTVKAEQKNIAEQQFRINTQVFAPGNDGATREYNSVCVTRGPVQLITFRIEDAL